MINVVLLGAGNVATHLFKAFQKADDITVNQVYNRNKEALSYFKSFTKTTTNLTELIDADVYIIAVKDDAIVPLSEQLKISNKLVVHTSGSVPMSSLSNNNRQGVFYPLQTFTKHKEVDFKMIPLCLETEHKVDMKIIEKLANSISNNVYQITSEQRKALHIAAVFVCNFVNHLYQKGEEICNEHHVPFNILKPLIQETAQKIITLSPEASQTGPAIRNDKKVIEQHLSDLSTPTQQEIYKLLTKSIQETHGYKL